MMLSKRNCIPTVVRVLLSQAETSVSRSPNIAGLSESPTSALPPSRFANPEVARQLALRAGNEQARNM